MDLIIVTPICISIIVLAYRNCVLQIRLKQIENSLVSLSEEIKTHKIAMIIDEGHRIFNYRENGSTEYNDKFMTHMKYR